MMTKEEKKHETQLRKKPVNEFTCLSCEKAKGLSFNNFKKHLVEEHKVKNFNGNRKMQMHMDGSYWYSSTYEWTLTNGLKFKQYSENARDNNDPMKYE